MTMGRINRRVKINRNQFDLLLATHMAIDHRLGQRLAHT